MASPPARPLLSARSGGTSLSAPAGTSWHAMVAAGGMVGAAPWSAGGAGGPSVELLASPLELWLLALRPSVCPCPWPCLCPDSTRHGTGEVNLMWRQNTLHLAAS